MKGSLTHKQQAVLSFIQNYFERYHRSPLIREIQESCQIASYKSALDRLNALERKTLIKRIPNKHRGIRLLRRPLPLLAAPASPVEIQVSGQTGEAVKV